MICQVVGRWKSFGGVCLWRLLAAGFAACCLSPTVFAQYRFDQWAVENGLPQNSIRAICQTADGYLWMATFDGLARFDGVRFTVFDKSNSPGVNSNRFIALLLDRNGDLWAGTENGGITRNHQGVFTTYTTQHGLPHNFVSGITGDEAGNLWVLSTNRIMRWDNGRFTRADVHDQAGLKIDFNVAVWNSQVFFGLDQKRLYRFAHGRLTSWAFPKELPRKRIATIGEDHTGTIWVWTNDRKLARLRDGQLLSIAGQIEALANLGSNEITNSLTPDRQVDYQDRQGGRWKIRIGPNLTQHILFETSGRTEHLGFGTIFEDREGNLWLGTDGQGLYRGRKQSIRVYSKQHGLVDRNVYAVFEDRFGAIWIGAWATGLSRFKDGAFTNFTLNDGLLSGTLSAIGEDRDGRLWISSNYNLNGGLQFLDNRGSRRFDRFTVFKDRIIPDVTPVAVIHQDREGVYWFGARLGLIRYQDGASSILTVKDGLAGEDVRVVIDAATGGLWIGAYGGLTRYQDGKMRGWTERDGLPSNSIRSLYEDRDGVLWIGTYDGGLGRFENGKFTHYTTRNGLFNNGVFQILEDARGNFWMSSNHGIQRVSKQELNDFAAGRVGSITAIAYGKSDGMLNAECNGGNQPAGIKARDGKLWFPTQDGVAVIDPETVPVNRHPPAVLIESFLLDRKPIAFDRPVRIAPGQENFEIEYTALSYANPEQIKFKYQLAGLNREWIDAGTRRTAYFSYVPPGEYTFRVIAANSDGVWNTEGKSLRIEVLPPFYRTWWFLTLTGLTVAGAVWLGVRYRINQLKREKAAQQAFSRQLIESQEGERKRIAAELHDSLGQNLLIVKNRALLGAMTEADEAARLQFNEISDSVSQTLEEVREIAYNLRPYHLDQLGLTTTIKAMIEKVDASCAVDFTSEIDNLDGLFQPADEITIYRIVQECLNNIVKHSRATEARVVIHCRERELEIFVQDNGCGIADWGLGIADLGGNENSHPLNPQSKGFGLTGMAERVRMLGGTQTVESSPGRGTRMIVKIELPRRQSIEK